MSRLIVMVLIVVCSSPLVLGQPPAGNLPALSDIKPARADLQTKDQQISYAFGYNLGRNLKDGEADLVTKLFVNGLIEGIEGKKSALTDEQLMVLIDAFHQKMAEKAGTRQTREDTKKIVAYLAKNKIQKGIKTTASGLQYRVLKKGNGKKPTPTDVVKVHYEGRLLNGTVFDSSKSRGPASFPVNRVIPGWTEALQLMQVGDKIQLFIPSELAYGPRGSGRSIGPNEVLIFDVELLDIVKK